MEVLRKQARVNRPALLRQLDLTKDLLCSLLKDNVISLPACVQIQETEDLATRNAIFLDEVATKHDDSTYSKLIECLLQTRQTQAASLLIDVGEELQVLNQMRIDLSIQMKQMEMFLKTEERRAGIYLTELPSNEYDGKPALTKEEIWSQTVESIKKSQQQLSRCQEIIRKLHKDCDTVAKQNSDIVDNIKECDAKIIEVLSFGRKSAKDRTGPKQTQQLFANLMDDIEKLVKTRKKVLDKETEGRRHCTRIIRQCRDWLESRCIALQKLNSVQASGKSTHLETADGVQVGNNSQRTLAPDNDNAIMSILASLHLLERELQNYIYQEIILSDKYRLELRRKHLQKISKGFNAQGISEMENVVNRLELNPESLKNDITILRACMQAINNEYDECVHYLNKMDPLTDVSHGESHSSPEQTTTNKDVIRDWPTNFKRKPIMGGRFNRSVENVSEAGKVSVREKVETNQLLNRIKFFTDVYEKQKSEDQDLSVKYHIELSKRKRDMQLALQKKDDQIVKLQTDIKESIAEKEKYKKLYNDTKFGYQKNIDNNTTS